MSNINNKYIYSDSMILTKTCFLKYWFQVLGHYSYKTVPLKIKMSVESRNVSKLEHIEDCNSCSAL